MRSEDITTAWRRSPSSFGAAGAEGKATIGKSGFCAGASGAFATGGATTKPAELAASVATALSNRLRSASEARPSSRRSASDSSGSKSGVTSWATNSPAYLPRPCALSQVWMSGHPEGPRLGGKAPRNSANRWRPLFEFIRQDGPPRRPGRVPRSERLGHLPAGLDDHDADEPGRRHGHGKSSARR